MGNKHCTRDSDCGGLAEHCHKHHTVIDGVNLYHRCKPHSDTYYIDRASPDAQAHAEPADASARLREEVLDGQRLQNWRLLAVPDLLHQPRHALPRLLRPPGRLLDASPRQQKIWKASPSS